MYFSVQISFFRRTNDCHKYLDAPHTISNELLPAIIQEQLKNIISENFGITICIGSSFNSQDMCRCDFGLAWIE